MTGFELLKPTTLRDAIDLLDTEDPGVRPFSGGTALMLMMKSGVFAPTRLVCLQDLEDDVSAITTTADGGVSIGALATLTELERSEAVGAVAPMVSLAMRRLANVRVRNVARVGGNLAHGDPHMDLPPILAALGAHVTVAGPQGERGLPVAELISGYYETVLGRGELIVRASVPPQAGWSSRYVKCTTRTADDWPALGIAVALRREGRRIIESRIFVSAATEHLTRLSAAEDRMKEGDLDRNLLLSVADTAADEAETIDDSRGSAAFKKDLLRVHLRRTLENIMEEQLH